MNKIVSDDSLSRALGAMDETRAEAWLSSQFDHVLAPLLGTPWILDIDTTIKLLYGKQDGATLGEREACPRGSAKPALGAQPPTSPVAPRTPITAT